jgi:hypothetical protein
VPVAALGHVPARELTEWAMFEEEFGPLTVQERIDAMAAYVAYTVHASAGGKGNPADFELQWRTAPKVPITDWLSAMARR